MVNFSNLLILLSLLVVPNQIGKTNKINENASSSYSFISATVHFLNKDIVNAQFCQESIKLSTPHGELNIDVKDIQKIDFGFRNSDNVNKNIEDFIKNLGDKNFKTREESVEKLIDYGYRAYPRLLSVLKIEKDLEVVKRTEKILEVIKKKTAKDLLNISNDDKIITNTSVIVGRIVDKSIKLSSGNFGEINIELNLLRSIDLSIIGDSKEVVVDSSKYPGNSNTLYGSVWFDTGIILKSGQLEINASGSVNLWSGDNSKNYICDPSGYKQGVQNNAVIGASEEMCSGMLIGKVGDGKAFAIGCNYNQPLTSEGKLYLCIVPTGWGQAMQGKYVVKIKN